MATLRNSGPSKWQASTLELWIGLDLTIATSTAVHGFYGSGLDREPGSQSRHYASVTSRQARTYLAASPPFGQYRITLHVKRSERHLTFIKRALLGAQKVNISELSGHG